MWSSLQRKRFNKISQLRKILGSCKNKRRQAFYLQGCPNGTHEVTKVFGNNVFRVTKPRDFYELRERDGNDYEAIVFDVYKFHTPRNLLKNASDFLTLFRTKIDRNIKTLKGEVELQAKVPIIVVSNDPPQLTHIFSIDTVRG